jgi:lysozyme
MSNLTEMLRRHEGCETHAYSCTANRLTIGCGRNIDPAGGLGLSEDEIIYLLENDITRCVKELEGFPWFPELVGARRDAMIDICFNLGISRLKLFKLALAAMGNHDYNTAAAEFINSKWSKQTGNRAIEVALMIKTGNYQ